MSMLRRSGSSAVLLAVIAGCSTYDADRHYDAAASEQPARVVEKRKFATNVQQAADSRSVHTVVPVAGAAGIVFVPLSMGSSGRAIIDVYEYAVETADRQRVLVYNDFPSLDIGHCVTLFISAKPTYPRISPVGRCP